ncbi:hypothetical protein R1sor_010281 [Riccia sorocarpa]|uniref:Uncharacterized protein n=1 Tax=Riccia sorocarpa TaxID=122646 RepID=A0ABD3I149_9MARC
MLLETGRNVTREIHVDVATERVNAHGGSSSMGNLKGVQVKLGRSLRPTQTQPLPGVFELGIRHSFMNVVELSQSQQQRGNQRFRCCPVKLYYSFLGIEGGHARDVKSVDSLVAGRKDERETLARSARSWRRKIAVLIPLIDRYIHHNVQTAYGIKAVKRVKATPWIRTMTIAPRSSKALARGNARRGRPKSRKHSEIRPSSVPDYVLRRTRRIYLDHFRLLTPSMSLSDFSYRLCKLLTHHNQMMTLCMSSPAVTNQRMSIINHHYQLLASTMCVLSYINSVKTPVSSEV